MANCKQCGRHARLKLLQLFAKDSSSTAHAENKQAEPPCQSGPGKVSVQIHRVSASRRLLPASQLKPKPSASMVGKSARSSITTEAWLRISDERPHNAAELPRTCLGVCLEQGCLLNVIKGPCARDFHLQPAEECFVGCCTLCLDQIRRPEAGTTLSSAPLPASQAYQSYPVLVSPAGCVN